jgi:gluconate 5-dehydrogenase
VEAFSLEGKLALVTGGSRGIGLGAARALAQAGANVILVGRAGDELNRAAEEIRQSGRRADVAQFDLSDTEGIAPWYDGQVALSGVPDILVNAAGITRRGPATELPLADWHAIMAVNLTAVFELSRCFARHLFAAGSGGKVVNIASLTTSVARRTTSAYTASKGGLGQLTKALAVDWADRKIHVNAIAPGYIDTEMNKALISDPEFDAWVKKRCPLGRWGTPADIAWPVVFLASPASDFITGQVIYVDGGWLATF